MRSGLSVGGVSTEGVGQSTSAGVERSVRAVESSPRQTASENCTGSPPMG